MRSCRPWVLMLVSVIAAACQRSTPSASGQPSARAPEDLSALVRAEVEANFGAFRAWEEEIRGRLGHYSVLMDRDMDFWPTTANRTPELLRPPASERPGGIWSRLPVQNVRCGYQVQGAAYAGAIVGPRARSFGFTGTAPVPWYYLVARCPSRTLGAPGHHYYFTSSVSPDIQDRAGE